MYDKQRVINLALSQIGYRETGNNYTKYAADLDAISGFYNGPKNGYAWCDVFVDWCFVKSYGVVGAKELLCQPDNSAGAGCAFSAGYFKAKGRFHHGQPETGDQIFFSYQDGEVSHTGLVVEVTAFSVVTVEGNTSDMVAKRSYPISDGRIYGYGRPDWGAEAAEDEPQDGEVAIIVDEPEVDVSKTENTTPAVSGLPMLRQGNKGETVRAAQFLLNGRGCSVGKWGADGEFGPMTHAAVLAFQRRNGLEADGIIGPKTWAKLLGL